MISTSKVALLAEEGGPHPNNSSVHLWGPYQGGQEEELLLQPPPYSGEGLALVAAHAQCLEHLMNFEYTLRTVSQF